MKLSITAALAVAGAMLTTQALAAGDPVAGKEKSAPCAACHGPDGNSPSPQFPRLAGQHADYIVKALEDYKSGERKNPLMMPFMAPLTKQDMKDLAAYFASQEGLHTIEFER